MSGTSSNDRPGALAAEGAEVPVRAGSDTFAQDSYGAPSFTVEGDVVEVLAGFGLAHVRAADGSTYGLNLETAGIKFADVHEGQRVRLEVSRKFNRVLYAELRG